MAFDPNMNLGASGATNDSLELPDWCHNEESFDLSTFISSNRNLELCNDDLFEALFPPNSPSTNDLNKDKTDKEVEHWSNQTPSRSHPASACSSTATSPAMQNYYNTPPVTPRTDLHRASPHHLQYEGLTNTMSLSANRLGMMNSSSNQTAKQLSFGIPSSSNLSMVKQEPYEQVQASLPFSISKTQVVPGPSMLQNERKTSSLNSNSNHGDVGQSTSALDPSSCSENYQERNSLATKRSQDMTDPSNTKKVKTVPKGSNEYFEKRKRNNVAVRRSRDKAKVKAMETQNRVTELTNENVALRRRIAQLSHELDTLKGLLTSLPQNSGNQGM